jgi:hypothetical protein
MSSMNQDIPPQQEQQQQKNEQSPLLGVTPAVSTETDTSTGGDEETGPETMSTTEDVVVDGQETDTTTVTKSRNLPLLECVALVALISGSLSMYWGISGLIFGTVTATTAASMVATMIMSQPMIIVHVVMSTCVVILAPVVTVQKVQLSALGTFREQQNALRLQVNTLQQSNDVLSKSITATADQTTEIQQVTDELRSIATATGTTMDRLVELCSEQERIQQEILQNLQAKVLQQIITATLQTDIDRNFIVSKQEVNVLMERLKHVPGVVLNDDAFRSVLDHSEPKGELTISDICRFARNLQQNDTTTNNTEKEIPMIEPVFTFQPKDILLST